MRDHVDALVWWLKDVLKCAGWLALIGIPIAYVIGKTVLVLGL